MRSSYMTIQIILVKCEKCGTTHPDLKSAKICEGSHNHKFQSTRVMTASMNTNLAQLLMRAFYWAENSLQNTLKERGWAEITKAQSQALISIVEGITRPSEIAARMSVTRQAIHQTINELIDLGYVSLEHDPTDKRAKVVTYTDKGHDLGQNIVLGLAEIEAQLISRIGVENVQALREALSQNWGEPYIPGYTTKQITHTQE